MYAAATSWRSWMKDFRYGTLVFIPDSNVKLIVDQLRAEYDSNSAQISMAHITLTQPFKKAPSKEDLQIVTQIINSFSSFEVVVGPVVTSPNKRLIWLDVSPKQKVIELRDRLHDSGLFRTDLPLTKGFIPHMTISEAGREPEEVQTISERLNERLKPWALSFSAIYWILPNEDFTFKEFQSFKLK